MSILTDPERVVAAAEVRELITSSGQTAVLLRKVGDENLYGSDEGEFEEVCTFPLPPHISAHFSLFSAVLSER